MRLLKLSGYKDVVQINFSKIKQEDKL